MTLRRRSFLAACCAVPAIAAVGVGTALRHAQAQSGSPSQGALAGVEGPVRTLDLDWSDAARQRPVPVRLYLPATASAARPAPLVVFSHGIGGSRRGYSYLGSHFAAEGFASLHLQHVGSDRSLWGAGNPLALVGRLQDAAQEAEAIARVHDLRFALTQALDGEFGALLDGQRVVAAGHSYGANTTLLASGARVVRGGRPLDLREPLAALNQAACVLGLSPLPRHTPVVQALQEWVKQVRSAGA